MFARWNPYQTGGTVESWNEQLSDVTRRLNAGQFLFSWNLAEEVGFEPTDSLHRR